MFNLIDLPYASDALAPHISADTLNVHHGKHHAAYVKKTNELLADKPDAPKALEDVVRMAKESGDQKLFNQAGQVWNHGFFWQCMRPDAQSPSGDFAKALESAFGSVSAFREQFLKTGETHFASGWAWLSADRDGKLKLTSMPNAETPLALGETPILVCDVWEHAYYLDYKNERPRFLQAFYDKLINWEFAAAQYEAARTGRDGWRYPLST